MGTDLAASLSASDSTTQGQQFNFSRALGGDFIVGGKKPTPPWLWIALAGAGVLVATIFLIRR